MLVGFNTNISYKNKTYHVQTEDGGPDNPVVITLLYYQGAILASKKTGYSELINDPDCYTKIAKLMKIQHKGVIRELLSGKYTENINVGQEKKTEKTNESENIKIVKETITEQSVLNRSEKVLEKESIEEALINEQKQVQDIELTEQEESKGKKHQLTNGLDDILLNFIMKRTK